MSGPRIDIVTIFPDLVEHFLEGSLIGAARREGRLDVRVTDLREFAQDRHRTVDDAPYGGGDGMVFRCEPVVAAIEAVRGPGASVYLTSPRGRLLDQPLAEELARAPQIVLVCGRYAGFDERIAEVTGAVELSIGDYVLSGGEIAALVVTEVVGRLHSAGRIPGSRGPRGPAVGRPRCGGALASRAGAAEDAGFSPGPTRQGRAFERGSQAPPGDGT
jgi:tRNA (guanine37-N1)-methyltransferase